MSRKLVKLTFIDDGDDMTDDAVLAGLIMAAKIRKAANNPAVKAKTSPSVTLRVSEFTKRDIS